ncbi:PREDICTED: uncharacterized protein LOC105447823 [Wasmannia auropunctata]|uniref:uncharacterized protein LOC105447823 n=1 Tax=Wasmannia auropunctata TaxID=64793 RepID=UPI0005EE703F|nr:PREDICTED: uncharacterized protein LOC105447823 [Wasmannia auropunctata]
MTYIVLHSKFFFAFQNILVTVACNICLYYLYCKMPKSFRELSSRQKNQRLKAYERHERVLIARNVDKSTTSKTHNLESRSHMNVPLKQYALLNDFNSDNNDVLPDDTNSDYLNVYFADVQNYDVHGTVEPENEENTRETTSKILLSNWLHYWKVKHNISHIALSELLSKLRTCGHTDLPKDARTLLSTPRNSIVEVSADNSFFHYGLKKAIIEQLARTQFIAENKIIQIDLNIDGLPISKSSKSQIWPILGKIYGDKAFTPFIISAYHGYSKPSVHNFLQPFCQEYNVLQNIGLVFGENRYTVQIRSVICDSPARAFVTCTKSHNGFFGCGKCTQEGTYCNHHMLFLESTASLRTDQNFKDRVQEDHHTGVSPFELIHLPMVSRFPLDYMHLVCLGVMKKLLQLWISGYQTSRLSGRKITELSEKLVAMSKWVPKEFARKLRSVDELARWKTTELRQFLLYLGPVVLLNILPEDNLLHFNVINCAIRILCHPTDCFRNNKYSKDLLIQSIHIFRQLYGDDTIIYNVHNLAHINEDVLMFGSLDNFSAFPFENYMQSIKKMLRKSEKPLQKLYKRISENFNETFQYDCNKSNMPILKKKSSKVPPMNCTSAYCIIEFSDFTLTDKKPNNCCYLTDKTIVVIEHICYNKEKIPVIIGKKFLTKNSLPFYPCESQNMDICVVKNASNLEMWPITEIVKKAVQLSFENANTWCCMPLLHSTFN